VELNKCEQQDVGTTVKKKKKKKVGGRTQYPQAGLTERKPLLTVHHQAHGEHRPVAVPDQPAKMSEVCHC
jgi:hypothetical protein